MPKLNFKIKGSGRTISYVWNNAQRITRTVSISYLHSDHLELEMFALFSTKLHEDLNRFCTHT